MSWQEMLLQKLGLSMINIFEEYNKTGTYKKLIYNLFSEYQIAWPEICQTFENLNKKYSEIINWQRK